MDNTKDLERLFLEQEVRHGAKNQIIVCIEELAELQKELTKYIRVDAEHSEDAIAEELADVEISCMNLRTMLENGEKVDKWKHDKIVRMKARLYL